MSLPLPGTSRFQAFFLLPGGGAAWSPLPLEELGVRSRGEPRDSWRLVGVVPYVPGRGLSATSLHRFLTSRGGGREGEVITQVWCYARSGPEVGLTLVVDAQGEARRAEKTPGERVSLLRAYRACSDPDTLLWGILDTLGHQETGLVLARLLEAVLGPDLSPSSRKLFEAARAWLQALSPRLASSRRSGPPRNPEPQTPFGLLEAASLAQWAVYRFLQLLPRTAEGGLRSWLGLLDCLLLYEALRLEGGVWVCSPSLRWVGAGERAPERLATSLSARTLSPGNQVLARTLTRVCPLGPLLLRGLLGPSRAE